MATNRGRTGFGGTQIRRHRINDIEFYEVTKEELKTLGKSSQSDKFLEIGIATGSSFLSLFAAWLTVEYENAQKQYIIYLIIWAIMAVAAAVMFYLWWTCRKDRKAIISNILNRPLE